MIKVALECHSLLLEKSLRKFLGKMVVSAEKADVVVSDHAFVTDKPLVRIGTDESADLPKPFSRSQLMIRLEETLKKREEASLLEGILADERETLEEKIEHAARMFAEEIVTIVREHYEKRK